MKKLGYQLFKTVVLLVLGFELGFFALYFKVPYLLAAQRQQKVVLNTQGQQLELFGMDWFPAMVQFWKGNKVLVFAATDLVLVTNEAVEVQGLPEGWRLAATRQVGAEFRYLLQSPDLADGEYTLDLQIVDASGNVLARTITLTAPSGRLAAATWPDYTFELEPESLTAIANKQHRLPQDYEPTDLVSLASLDIHNNNSARIRQLAADHLKQLTNAIMAAGIDYTITSGYRSYQDQVNAYNFWLGYYSGDVADADRVSARPGFSEHQLGTTVDFLTNANGNIFYGFEFTPLANWLVAHAHEYGFVLSYPAGKEAVTGYSYEPWHFRYVGLENAQIIKSGGLTLTEWLLSISQPESPDS